QARGGVFIRAAPGDQATRRPRFSRWRRVATSGRTGRAADVSTTGPARVFPMAKRTSIARAPREFVAAADSERDCWQRAPARPDCLLAGVLQCAAPWDSNARHPEMQTTNSNRSAADRARRYQAPCLDPAA